MAGKLLLLFTVLCSVLFTGPAFDIRRKKVIIKSWTDCKEGENFILTWYGFSFKNVEKSGGGIAGIKVRAKTLISRDLSINFNFWKCDLSGNLDNCEQFLKDLLVKDICTYMEQKNKLWSPFMEGFSTPLVCPIKPGVYEAKSLPIDSRFLSFLPIGDALWKVKMEGFDQGTRISCVMLIMQITPAYGRKN